MALLDRHLRTKTQPHVTNERQGNGDYGKKNLKGKKYLNIFRSTAIKQQQQFNKLCVMGDSVVSL